MSMYNITILYVQVDVNKQWMCLFKSHKFLGSCIYSALQGNQLEIKDLNKRPEH